MDLQKELTYFWRKLARKPKHDTSKNFKQIQSVKNGEERVSFRVKLVQSSFWHAGKQGPRALENSRGPRTLEDSDTKGSRTLEYPGP